MQIRSFTVTNFKSLRKTTVDNLGNIAVFIGKNNSGKTSLFQAIEFFITKDPNRSVLAECRELVSNGLNGADTKNLTLRMKIELSEEERLGYLRQFFEPETMYEQALEGELLRYLTIEATATTASPRAEQMGLASGRERIRLLRVTVSNARGGQLTIAHRENRTASYLKVIRGPLRFTSSLGDISAAPSENVSDGLCYSDARRVATHLPCQLLHDLRRNLVVVPSYRSSLKQVEVKYVDRPAPGGSNILQKIAAMYFNNREQFDKIAAITRTLVPGIEDFKLQLLTNSRCALYFRERGVSHLVDLEHSGMGIEQLVILVWQIATAEPGTIFLIDEPELHLHAAAQRLFFNFLQEQSQNKQILLATQSNVFINAVAPEELYLVTKREGWTKVEQLSTLGDINRIIRTLGNRKSDVLEPAAVVFVEGEVDAAVLSQFAIVLGQPFDPVALRLIPVGGKANMDYFADAELLVALGKRLLVILDSDGKDPEKVKEYLTSSKRGARRVAPEDIHVLKEYSIESYLLDVQAIAKATSGNPREIAAFLSNCEGEPNKKKVLDSLFSEVLRRPYRPTIDAPKIASSFSTQQLQTIKEIVELIEKIHQRATPAEGDDQ